MGLQLRRWPFIQCDLSLLEGKQEQQVDIIHAVLIVRQYIKAEENCLIYKDKWT